jgi:hypothetical protein
LHTTVMSTTSEKLVSTSPFFNTPFTSR